MRLIPLCLVLITTLPPATASLLITEIMYNPLGDDNNKEYVEVTLTEFHNLTGYALEDLDANDTLQPLQVNTASLYALIVEEGYNFIGINASVYTTGATIGNNLNNDADAIIIRDPNGTIQDLTAYTSALGGNNNGQALCKHDTTLYECPPTPGNPNPLPPIMNTTNTTNTTNSEATNTTAQQAPPLQNATNTSEQPINLHITELLPDPAGNDNAPLPHGEWVELHNPTNFDINAAGLILKDKNGNTLTITNAHVTETTTILPHDYKVIYMNGQNLLNNNGFEKIQLLNQQTILHEISYEGSERDKSWSIIDETLYLTDPTPGEENRAPDPDEENQTTTFPKHSKNKPTKPTPVASALHLAILETNDIFYFGDEIKTKLTLYKGNTRKTAVKLHIPTVTKPVTFTIYTKHTNTTLTFPFQLGTPCNPKNKNGTYTLTLEGLDTKTTYDITLAENPACHTTAKTATFARGVDTTNPESFISYQQSLTGDVVYESNDVKARTTALILFAAGVLLTTGYLLREQWKKKKSLSKPSSKS